MKLLTVKEAAEFLKVSKSTVYRYVRKSLIPYIRKGRRILFIQKDLEEWLERDRHDPRFILTDASQILMNIMEKGDEFMPKGKSRTRLAFGNGVTFIRKTVSGKIRFYVEFYNAENKRTRKIIKSATNWQEAKAGLDKEVQRALDIKYGIRREKEKIQFNDFCDLYLEDYSKINKRSWKADRSYLKNMKEFFNDYYLREVSSQDIEMYKRERLKQGVRSSTVNRCLAILRKMLNLAEEWGYLPEGRKVKIKLFPEKDNLMERILTEQEEVSLMDKSSEHLRSILIIALNTGMRKGEILNLQWNQIDFRARRIRVEKTKSGKIRFIPINNVLLDELLKLVSRNGQSPYLFFNPGTGKPYQDVKKAFKAACRRAGIKGLRMHDLRHTFATRLVERGIDLITVRDLLGHSTVKITERYTHPGQEAQRQAVELLARREGIPKDLARICPTRKAIISDITQVRP